MPEDGGSTNGKERLEEDLVFRRHMPHPALGKKWPEEVRCWNERRRKCRAAVGKKREGTQAVPD